MLMNTRLFPQSTGDSFRPFHIFFELITKKKKVDKT